MTAIETLKSVRTNEGRYRLFYQASDKQVIADKNKQQKKRPNEQVGSISNKKPKAVPRVVIDVDDEKHLDYDEGTDESYEPVEDETDDETSYEEEESEDREEEDIPDHNSRPDNVANNEPEDPEPNNESVPVVEVPQVDLVNTNDPVNQPINDPHFAISEPSTNAVSALKSVSHKINDMIVDSPGGSTESDGKKSDMSSLAGHFTTLKSVPSPNIDANTNTGSTVPIRPIRRKPIRAINKSPSAASR